MQLALAIDPGETSGYVVGNLDSGYIEAAATMRGYEKVEELIRAYHPKVLVLEKFRLYPHMARTMVGSEFEVVQVIGVIKYLATLYEVPLVEQAASLIDFIKDELSASGNPHVHDARSHFEYYRRSLKNS